MRITPILATLALTAATPAVAQDIAECDWRASATAIAEPWEENTRTFANGDVRITLLDVGEPAFGGYHLLVLSPPFDETGFAQCRLVTYEDTQGFGGVNFTYLDADYDPSIGLIFYVPVTAHYGDEGFVLQGLGFTLNQATGEMTSWLE